MRARLPIGIYSEDGEQGWNFNAQIKIAEPIVCDIYEAAIEVVSKQILTQSERKQMAMDGWNKEYDLIGGNKIILFQKKEANLQYMHEQGGINTSGKLTTKILSTASQKNLKKRIELSGSKDPENISYAIYLPQILPDKYYFDIAKDIIQHKQGTGQLGQTIREILSNSSTEESMQQIMQN